MYLQIAWSQNLQYQSWLNPAADGLHIHPGFHILMTNYEYIHAARLTSDRSICKLYVQHTHPRPWSSILMLPVRNDRSVVQGSLDIHLQEWLQVTCITQEPINKHQYCVPGWWMFLKLLPTWKYTNSTYSRAKQHYTIAATRNKQQYKQQNKNWAATIVHQIHSATLAQEYCLSSCLRWCRRLHLDSTVVWLSSDSRLWIVSEVILHHASRSLLTQYMPVLYFPFSGNGIICFGAGFYG